MIVQIDKATGAVLSFDYTNVLEDVQRSTPSYIDVVTVNKTYLDGLTKSGLQKMADLGNIPFEEGAAKGAILDAILKFKPEVIDGD